MAKILITGGSGMLGQLISQSLLQDGHEMVHLSRTATKNSKIKTFYWNVEQNFIEEGAFEHVDTIVHLAGAGIADKRWTNKRKQEIIDSRVKSSKLLFDEIKKQNASIKTFVGASAVGYYGSCLKDQTFTETDRPGTGFLAHTCKFWENSYVPFIEAGIRTVILRFGVILHPKAGAFPKMMLPFRYGLGTYLAGGNPYFPWIEGTDAARLIKFAITTTTLEGIFNAVATQIQTNKQFSDLLAKHLKKRILLPSVPEILLKLIMGEKREVITRGANISNQKIRNKGFVFQFETLEETLVKLLSKTNR